MRGTKFFEETIKAYLDKRAKEDELFAVAYAKEGKSISECCNYILQEVGKSGRSGFADEEIYGMAVHYYDEENVKAKEMPSHVRVVVNHKIEKEEKQTTVREEVKPVQMEQKKPAPAVKPKKNRKQMEEEFEQRQLSLFEL
jgi:hypothetical protein